MASGDRHDVVAVVSGYFLTFEQKLLSVTYALIGASAGFISGSIKASHQLQHNFTSADGLRELWLGSKHAGGEKDTRSFTDLLTSWIPGHQGGTTPAKGLPALDASAPASHAHTNGVANDTAAEHVINNAAPVKPIKDDSEELTDTFADPAPASKKPQRKPSNIFTIKRFTTSEETEVIPVHHLASPMDSFATTTSATHTDDSALVSGPPTRTVSWDRDGICSEAETVGEAEADGNKPQKKRKIFKKLGKKVKKAFEPLTHSCSSSPKKA